jgi:hypothetical protein
METPLSPAVLEALSSLTEEQQFRVIALARKAQPPLSREERIKKLAELAGTMPKEDADEMMAIIDEGCGQINHNAW